jgi:hypothetical protein
MHYQRAALAAAFTAQLTVAAFAVDIEVPGDYSSIQAAVNAASNGDTIHVGPGTYVEQIFITNKELAILGDGAVIEAPAILVAMSSGPTFQKPVVGVAGGDVTIDGFTVDGKATGAANNNLIGVYFLNASGMLSNCVVKNTRHNPLNGVQGGLGVLARNYTSGTKTLRILNNHVFGFQKNGITTNNLTGVPADLNVSINGNLVEGKGASLEIAQNGIQVWAATGEVKRNKVKDIEWTGPTWVATGILAFDTGSMMFEGNEITNCQVGLYLTDSVGGAGPQNNHVVNNEVVRTVSFSNYFYGLYMAGGSTNKVVNNRFTDVDAGIGYYYSSNAKFIANRFVGLRDGLLDPVYNDGGPEARVRATKAE